MTAGLLPLGLTLRWREPHWFSPSFGNRFASMEAAEVGERQMHQGHRFSRRSWPVYLIGTGTGLPDALRGGQGDGLGK